jgi:hypothetical protein
MIPDFSRWEEDEAYMKAFERLMRVYRGRKVNI